MGLDVYLYKYDDKAASDKLEARYEKESKKNYKGYDSMTKAQKDAAHEKNKAAAARLGLGDWGSDDARKHQIENNSAKHPEHMFKIGYFRSSYNEGGINRKLDLCGIRGLAEIFQTGDEYCFQPDWKASKKRAATALAKMREMAEEVAGCEVTCIDQSPFRDPPNIKADEAMAIYRKTKTEEHAFDSFSTSEGTFYMKDPLRVVAAVPGKSVLGTPCVYLIYQSEGWDWYFQALEVVIETCDFVMAQPDPQKYWLHWSG